MWDKFWGGGGAGYGWHALGDTNGEPGLSLSSAQCAAAAGLRGAPCREGSRHTLLPHRLHVAAFPALDCKIVSTAFHVLEIQAPECFEMVVMSPIVSPQKMLKSPTSAYECDLVWKWTLVQVGMRSLGRTLNPLVWTPRAASTCSEPCQVQELWGRRVRHTSNSVRGTGGLKGTTVPTLTQD